MATVVITCFLIELYDFKMDADFDEKQRDIISRREKRWSMNSQRLEEIVAELMKPISDVRRTFDTDLSALLEEYLTEAGLHALEAEVSSEDEGEGAAVAAAAAATVSPNFPELALLLQQSASIYGRKVDFLYQHVLAVSDSLHNSTMESEEGAGSAEAQTPGRRKRKASATGGGGGGEWTRISLTSSAGACRPVPAPCRPPPVLPRAYLELEPRVLSARAAPLADYAGEPIGLLADFQVTWRLQNGLLVEDLKCVKSGEPPPLRPVPLAELRAAIEEACPLSPIAPPTPPLASTPLPPASTPLPPASTPLPPASSPALAPDKRQRKRKINVSMEDLTGTIKLIISAEGRRALSVQSEFSVCEEWVRAAVSRRRARLVLGRDSTRLPPDLQAGFPGWSAAEARTAAAAVTGAGAGPAGSGPAGAGPAGAGADSDDDGFFEQSSLGDSEGSRVDDTLLNTTTQSSLVASWPVSAAAADVRALAARVLRATDPARDVTHVDQVLAAAADHPADVSKLFLATLFLANAGNVEIVQGAPLTLNSFGVRVLSRDHAALPTSLDHDRDHDQR